MESARERREYLFQDALELKVKWVELDGRLLDDPHVMRWNFS